MVSSNSRDQVAQQLADLSVGSGPSSGTTSRTSTNTITRPPLVPRSPTIKTTPRLVWQHSSLEQSYGSDPEEALFDLGRRQDSLEKEDKKRPITPSTDSPAQPPPTSHLHVLATPTATSPVPVPRSPARSPTPSSQSTSSSRLLFGPSSSCARDEYCWMESPPEFPLSERAVDVGWVGGWATDFDILLSDPIGVKAFTDFLCKEFSYENLQFFLAVQEFKKLDCTNQEELKSRADFIYTTFISPEATEPVNVDSKARKATEIALQSAPITTRVFALPEKQIYNLMKFDSYQRFLKSDIFKECSSLDLQGKPLPYETAATDSLSGTPDSAAGGTNGGSSNSSHSSSHGKSDVAGAAPPTKSKTKRRSIIPNWARIKTSISNVKAASLSSESSFRRPMMVRKFTNSITKIRSKSLDDHINTHIAKHPNVSDPSGTKQGPATGPGHSSSVDKAVTIPQHSLHDSRNSDSLDLSENNNVFSPSPDPRLGDSGPVSRVASLSTDSTSTEQSPVNSGPGITAGATFPHRCQRESCHLLRVTFPDGSLTVVSAVPNETLSSMIRRLLVKRAIELSAFEVFRVGDAMPLDPALIVTTLGCADVRIEPPPHHHFRAIKSLVKQTKVSQLSISSSSSPRATSPVRPQRAQRSLEETRENPPPSAPMRRFHSVSIDKQTSGEVQADQNRAPIRATYKASHLRELQNHQNFKSYADRQAEAAPEPAPRTHKSGTRTTAITTTSGNNENQPQTTTTKRPNSQTAQVQQHLSLQSESPPGEFKPPLRRFQSDPPVPGPQIPAAAVKKSSNPTPVVEQAAPMRPPTLGSQNSLPANLFHSLEHHHAHFHPHHHHHHHPHHPIIYHTHHHHDHSHIHPPRRGPGPSSTPAAAPQPQPSTGRVDG